MKICVLGATGFMGSCLTKYFSCVEGIDLCAVSRTFRSSPLSHVGRMQWIRGDLISLDLCREIVSHNDVIIHLAHSSHPLVSDKDLPGDLMTNLLPSMNLLQAIRESHKTPHLIFASSAGAVYGDSCFGKTWNETDPCCPMSNYGIQKLMVEHYLRLWSERGYITSTVLRIANAYGILLPPERRQGLIGIAMKRILGGMPVRIFGKLDNIRDYIHINDVLEAVMLCIERREPFEVFNIGSGQGYSVSEVLTKIILCMVKTMIFSSD